MVKNNYSYLEKQTDPIKVTLIWNQASSEQYLISQADDMSTPPPTQALWIAAITGLVH